MNIESTNREMLCQGIATGIHFSFLPLQIWQELELSFPHLQLSLEGLIEELAEESFRDTLRLV